MATARTATSRSRPRAIAANEWLLALVRPVPDESDGPVARHALHRDGEMIVRSVHALLHEDLAEGC